MKVSSRVTKYWNFVAVPKLCGSKSLMYRIFQLKKKKKEIFVYFCLTDIHVKIFDLLGKL